jgi:hypothetical protein
MAKENEKTDKELLLEEIQGLITDSQKDGVKKADLDKKIEAINKTIADKLDNAEMKALKENVDKLVAAAAENAAAIKAMGEVASKKEADKPKTLAEALVDAFKESAKDVPNLVTEKTDSEGNKKLSIRDYFQKLGNKQTPELVIKVGVDMLETTIVQANVATTRLTDLDPNRVGTPLAVYQHVTDWMPIKGITKKYMSILVVYDYQDYAGTKTQGSAYAKSSFLFKTVEFVSAVIGTLFRVSDESLDDLPEAMQEIALVAPDKIKNNIDYQILGSAGNDTTTIKGLYASSKKTDFASGSTYSGKVANANKVDVISFMKDQAETSKYIADTIILNPTDVRLLAAEKDQLDNSKVDRRVVFDALGEPVAVCGMLIKRNVNQTVDTVTVLARNMVQIGDRKQMTLEVGFDGSDFSEGYKTIRIGVRLAFAVRDPLAVIYCSGLDAAVTAISV